MVRETDMKLFVLLYQILGHPRDYLRNSQTSGCGNIKWYCVQNGKEDKKKEEAQIMIPFQCGSFIDTP